MPHAISPRFSSRLGRWPLLLGGYWLALALTVVLVTAGLPPTAALVMLLAGIPLYSFAVRSMARSADDAAVSVEPAAPDNLLPFPPRREAGRAIDIAQAAAEARASQLRKLG